VIAGWLAVLVIFKQPLAPVQLAELASGSGMA
jgi:hypothetical protein